MDLATENRIASILLKEAAELRRQAEKEGALAYLHRPNVRGRPNSRFLTATVLGVQQANRAVEEGEMWRARQKELELDNRIRRRNTDEDNSSKSSRHPKESRKRNNRPSGSEVDVGPSCLPRERADEDGYLTEDEGLKDDEVDDFLRSRNKRGRGAIGSRMDEAGPYLPSDVGTKENEWSISNTDEAKCERPRVPLGPEKPSFIGGSKFSGDESFVRKHKEVKKVCSKHSSKKHKSKSRDKEKKKKKRTREEKSSKHRKE